MHLEVIPPVPLSRPSPTRNIIPSLYKIGTRTKKGDSQTDTFSLSAVFYPRVFPFRPPGKSGEEDKQRQAKTNKGKQRQTKRNKDEQRQTRTNKDKQRQTKPNNAKGSQRETMPNNAKQREMRANKDKQRKRRTKQDEERQRRRKGR